MAHVEKYTNTQSGHLLNHYNRDKEKDCNRSNEDIDKTKTKDNYNLMQREATPQEYYKSRLDELYKLERADVKTMCDWVITLPKDFDGNERDFFTHTVDFLNGRYGANNCVGAFVHLDEKQPHMHYSFIPVSEDRNPEHKQEEKVCAKEVLNRNDLKTFHDDLQKHLREKMPDREINVITGITQEQGRNMSVREIKLQAKAERLQEKEKEVAEKETRLSEKEEKLRNKKKENLERTKELDRQKKELAQKEKGLEVKKKEIDEREKDFDKYVSYRERYCIDRGITQTQYERECFQAKLTNELKPYPEMINPALAKEERQELIGRYKEQQEHTHEHEREMPNR